MSIKTKLISLVMTFVLITSLLTVGVFAVKNTSFNVGGNIVFNAQGIEAEVKLEALNNGSLIAPQTLANKMLAFELNNDMTESQVLACYESWANLDLQFDSEEDVTLQIRITNTTEIADNYIKVDLTTTQGTANNCSVTVDKSTATIKPGDYQIFTITFSIDEPDYNASLKGFAVNIKMSKTDTIPVEVKHDEENNYYYIEMGTYGGNPVRWRYVSDVTNAADGDDMLANATRFDPTISTPNSTTGSKGMFILESDIFTLDDIKNGASSNLNDGIIEFLSSNMFDSSTRKHTTSGYTSIYAYDYAASDLRAFLTARRNVAGQDVGNLMNVLGIESNNEIYEKIQGRTLSDLYSSIDDGSAATLPIQFDGSETDMFWSLSYNEAVIILGGGEEGQNELYWKSPAYDEYNTGGAYWLRSSVDFQYAWRYGNISEGPTANDLAARPAFILEF